MLAIRAALMPAQQFLGLSGEGIKNTAHLNSTYMPHPDHLQMYLLALYVSYLDR